MNMSWNPDPGYPHFSKMATVTADCHHCGRQTRFVQESVQDAEANYWRERHEKLQASLNDVIERCNKKHGYNPVQDWFMEELLKLRDGLDRT